MTNDLKKIIKNDDDRLFILDHECYLFFTGDSITDTQPFIRFGNWDRLPPEVIPLIETIIITEKQIGNPVYEKINIDLMELSQNCYVGNENTFNNYQAIQNLFSLDLNKCQFRDIGPDTPEFEKVTHNNNNEILGIFTLHGNFKVVHNDNILFELSGLYDTKCSYNAFFDFLSSNLDENNNQDTGFMFMDEILALFNSNHTTLIQYPSDITKLIEYTKINPKNIECIIQINENISGIIPFIKWKNKSGTPVTIFCNNDRIKKTDQCSDYSHSVKFQKIKNIHYKHEHAAIKQYQNSNNFRLTYFIKQPDCHEVTVAYITEHGSINSVLKDTIDFIIITYSVYEQSNLLFKSSTVPYLILEDANPNFKKALQGNFPLLFKNIRYNILRSLSITDLMQISGLNDSLLYALLSLNIAEINRIMETVDQKTIAYQAIIYNSLNILSIIEQNSTERPRVLEINKIYSSLKKQFHYDLLLKHYSRIEMTVVYYEGTVCIFCHEHNNVSHLNCKLKSHPIMKRIERDRERLKEFLSLYAKNRNKDSGYDDKVAQLKKQIDQQKEKTQGPTPGEKSFQSLVRDVYNKKIKTIYNRITAK